MKFFHVWFSTKYRKGALESPEISDVVAKTMRSVADRNLIEIEELQQAVDHVHLLLRLRDDQNLAVAIHDLKGASSHAVHLAFPELKMDMGTHSLWQKGYGSRLISPAEI